MLYKSILATITTTGKPHLLLCAESLKHYRGLYSCSYFGYLQRDKFKRKEFLHVKNCAYDKNSINLCSTFNKSCIFVKRSELKPVNNFQIRKQSDDVKKNCVDPIRLQQYSPLYLFEHIRLFRIVGFTARISAFLFALSCPISLALYFSGSVIIETALKIIALTTLNTLLFTIPSILLTSRVVGKIMLSEDRKYLKISHLSIFGNRRDIYVRPQDLFLKKTPEKTIMKIIKFQNSSKKLIFLPSNGTDDTEFEILDEIFSGKICQKNADQQL